MKPSLSILLLSAGAAAAQSADLLPHTLDELVVTASATPRTLFDLAQPATVLRGDALTQEPALTLGDLLDGQAGVSATQFAPGASRPIVRGLGDDRVRILQNGTSVLDVSNVSPDHAVASDPSGLSAVEIVRGPATLLYGPNAIGGVVNLIDDRVPEKLAEDGKPSGHLDTRYGSVDDLRSLSGAVNFSAGPFAFHLDAFTRETNDVEIPGYARSRQLRRDDPQPDEARGFLPNSATNTEGAAFGSSYIWDKGFVGASYSGMNSDYGTVAEEDVTIELRQRRWDVRGAFYEPVEWLREINYKFSHSDYEHSELEDGEVGTRFLTDGFNARSEFKHTAVRGFEGAVGFEIQDNDFSALGDEAFLPSVRNRAQSLFLFEEIDLEPFLLQFGARYDRQTNESDLADRHFDAFSTSAGIVWNPVENYAVSLSAGYSERPPTHVELFADGLHVATDTYEQGDSTLGTENALSLDLSVRKKTGRVTGSAGVFYYRFDDFIALQDTGVDSGEVDDDGDPYTIFAFQPVGADFYGGEVETVFHLLGPVEAEANERDGHLDLILRADYVRAQNRDDDEPLPRIPPFRSTLALDYRRDHFGARLEGQWAARQGRTAEGESSTDSYFLLNAGLSYDLKLADVTTTFFVKAINLLDEEARQSTSFLKDVSPLPGRGLLVGLRSEF